MALPKTLEEICRGNCRGIRSSCRSASVLSPSFVLSLFVLLALINISHAQAVTEMLQALGARLSWVPLLVGAFAVGFGLAAIAYMLSAVFRLPELGVWAKSEVGEMVGTAFLVAIVLLAMTAADGIYLAATGSTPMGQSISFTETLTNKLLDIYIEGFDLSTTIGFISGPPPQYARGGSASDKRAEMIKQLEAEHGKVSFSSSGPSFTLLILTLSMVNPSYQKFSGLGPLSGHFNFVQSSVASAAAITVVLQMIASFINEIALPVLIPLGVFLSCFSLTRKMGRTFIAFGVGLYFFFPASIIISKTMYCSAFKNSGDPVCGTGAAIPEIAEPSSDFIGERIEGLQWLMTGLALIPLFPKIIGVVPYPFIGSCPAVAGACPLLLYFVCLAICTFWQLLVVWPLTSYIGQYVVYPIMLAGVTLAPIAGEAGVPDLLRVLSAAPFVGSYASFKAQYYVERTAAEQLSGIILNYTPYALQYSVPVMLMPIIILIVVITAIRSISPAIGGEVQILGVSELI